MKIYILNVSIVYILNNIIYYLLFLQITKEYSWIDRTWSTAPVVYVCYIAWYEVGNDNFSTSSINQMKH